MTWHVQKTRQCAHARRKNGPHAHDKNRHGPHMKKPQARDASIPKREKMIVWEAAAVTVATVTTAIVQIADSARRSAPF